MCNVKVITWWLTDMPCRCWKAHPSQVHYSASLSFGTSLRTRETLVLLICSTRWPRGPRTASILCFVALNPWSHPSIISAASFSMPFRCSQYLSSKPLSVLELSSFACHRTNHWARLKSSGFQHNVAPEAFFGSVLKLFTADNGLCVKGLTRVLSLPDLAGLYRGQQAWVISSVTVRKGSSLPIRFSPTLGRLSPLQ
jgi:hypothetical protein